MSNSDAMKAAWHILLFALASTAALTDSEIVARLEKAFIDDRSVEPDFPTPLYD